MNANVSVTLAGTKPARPPIITLLLDVTLKNDDKAPRWVLIPSKLPLRVAADKAGVDTLEQLAAGNVAIGRLLGTGGRYAVRLAPGATAQLHKVEVAWWRDDPDAKKLSFDVQVASDVKVGGASLETWFTGDPSITGKADADFASAKNKAVHRAPDNKEQPLEIVGATATSISVSLP